MSAGADAITKKPTIVLIHGQWLTPRIWERWIDRFQKAGHDVLAPAWPGLAAETDEIRISRTTLVGIRLDDVVAHYERIIRNLDAPPILMGHSSGALIVRLLIERGVGAAGVLIDQGQDAQARPFSLLSPKAGTTAGFNKRGKPAVLVIDGAKRGQNTLGQNGWEEVADFALRWALENSRDRMTIDQVKAAFAPPVLTESREHQVQM